MILMSVKERLSVSVDGDHAAAGRAAVAEGRSESLSAWVNEALARHAAHERRLRALDAFFAAYEAEHGEITAEEMVAAKRHYQQRAVVVRGAAMSSS